MNDRQKKQQNISAHICKKLGHKLISYMLSLCEERLRNAKTPFTNALTHAALNAKYAIETFLNLVDMENK